MGTTSARCGIDLELRSLASASEEQAVKECHRQRPTSYAYRPATFESSHSGFRLAFSTLTGNGRPLRYASARLALAWLTGNRRPLRHVFPFSSMRANRRADLLRTGSAPWNMLS